VIDGIVSQLDLFPTICELAGIDFPDWLEGTSLLPLVTEEIDQVHEYVFGEVNYHDGYRPTRTVRSQRYRYVRWYVDRLDLSHERRLANARGKDSTRLWLDGGRYTGKLPEEELFDLQADPIEMRNLANRPEYEEIKRELSEVLSEWMERVQDPLLSGRIDAPPTYIEHYPDGATKEQIMRRWFARPGRYASEWKPDPYVIAE
jgi:arylsulfatase A-like enzyme